MAAEKESTCTESFIVEIGGEGRKSQGSFSANEVFAPSETVGVHRAGSGRWVGGIPEHPGGNPHLCTLEESSIASSRGP